MRAIILRVTTILALVMAVTAISAQAQTSLNTKKFTVPFEFNVGDKVLPAGEYTVLVENQVIRMRKNDGKANASAIAQRTVRSSRVNNEVKLTFRLYGDHAYLSQVLLPDGVGRELKGHRKENRELVQNFRIIEVQGHGR
jgi:hypothetical protein